MPVSSKTLGAIVNAGLKALGEPEITAFTTTNILQTTMIEAANNAVRDIRDRFNPDWVYKRTTLQMTDDVTTEEAAVTNGSTTVTSVDEDGNDATNWTSGVAAGMWFRASGDKDSYLISTVDAVSDPNTIVLENAYRGTTSTATGYRIFQDTYAISDADFGQLQLAAYGDASGWVSGLQGNVGNHQMGIISMTELHKRTGGDLHRDTGGRPVFITEIIPDSSNNPQFIFWPFPTENWIIELWYSVEYTENSTFATVMFGSDAPPTAYDAVEHAVKSAALLWDEDERKAAIFEQKYQLAIANLIRRDNRDRKDVGYDVATYRRQYGVRYPVASQIYFDGKAAQR